MMVALLMLIVVFLYLVIFAGALALELALAAVFLLWPCFLPIAIGWKLVLIGIWLFILLVINAK